MILYGRNLSPFTRRVALWCAAQGVEVERRELAVAGDDFAVIASHNPVARVPILELDDGTHLIETFAICDYLDDIALAEKKLVPPTGLARLECMQRIALANSTCEKIVAAVYETVRRPAEVQWDVWSDRLMGQATGGLQALEALVPEPGAHAPDGGDIAMAITQHFAETALPAILAPGYPRLKALGARAMDWPGVAATMPKV